jgi:hypothetical protein
MDPTPRSRPDARGADPVRREVGWVALLLVALALATLASSALGPPPERFPTSDLAVLELGVRLAAEGAQRLGPEARFYFQHPGPAAFYFAVPFYRALGEGALGLGAAALAWNLLALLVYVWAFGRLLGTGGATLAAALAFGVLATRGVGFLLSFWNANLPVLPWAAALAASALVAAGQARALALVAFFGSLAVQSHAVYLVPVGLVTIAGIVGWALPASRTAGSGRRSGLALALATTALVLVALWALPLWDEWTGDYHNLRRLLGTGGRPRANAWPLALAAAGRALLGFAGAPRENPAWGLPLLAAFGLGAAFAGASAVAWRRRDRSATALAVVATAALAAVVVTARAVPGALRFPYVLHWAAFAGAAAVMLVATVFLDGSPRWRTRLGGRGGRAGLALAAGTLLFVRVHGLLASPPPPREPGPLRVERASLEIESRLDAAWRGLPPAARPTVLLRVGGEVDRNDVVGLILALDKAGVRFTVEPFGAYRFEGHLEPTGREHGELLVGVLPASGRVEPLSSEPDLRVVLATPSPGEARPEPR